MISYIGGKRDLAPKILRHIKIPQSSRFYDMCCGSGEISLALVRQGFDPKRITMVDNGPWGEVWEKIGKGTFSIDRFARICHQFNTYQDIKGWCRQASCDRDRVYNFLILQACSFGGRPVTIQDGQFKISGFRQNIQPAIPVLYRRVKEAVERLAGMEGSKKSVLQIQPEQDAVLFFDPPYNTETKVYQDNTLTVSQIRKKFSNFYCTFSCELAPGGVKLHTDSRKAGVKGDRVHFRTEYLSLIQRVCNG